MITLTVKARVMWLVWFALVASILACYVLGASGVIG